MSFTAHTGTALNRPYYAYTLNTFFSDSWRTLSYEYGVQDAYFYYFGHRVYLSILGFTFFDSLTSWQSFRTHVITFFYLPRAIKADQQYFLNNKPDIQNPVYLLPFNNYTASVVYSGNSGNMATITPTSDVTTSKVFSIRNIPVTFIDEQLPYDGYSNPRLVNFYEDGPNWTIERRLHFNGLIVYFDSTPLEEFRITAEYFDNPVFLDPFKLHETLLATEQAPFYLFQFARLVYQSRFTINFEYVSGASFQPKPTKIYTIVKPIIGNKSLICTSKDSTPEHYEPITVTKLNDYTSMIYWDGTSNPVFLSKNSSEFMEKLEDTNLLFIAVPFDLDMQYTRHGANRIYFEFNETKLLMWDFLNSEPNCFVMTPAMLFFIDENGQYGQTFNCIDYEYPKGWVCYHYTQFLSYIDPNPNMRLFGITPANTTVSHTILQGMNQFLGLYNANTIDNLSLVFNPDQAPYQGQEKVTAAQILSKNEATMEVQTFNYYNCADTGREYGFPDPKQDTRWDKHYSVWNELQNNYFQSGPLVTVNTVDDSPLQAGIRIPQPYFSIQRHARGFANYNLAIKMVVVFDPFILLTAEKFIIPQLVKEKCRYFNVNVMVDTLSYPSNMPNYTIFLIGKSDYYGDNSKKLLFTNLVDQPISPIYKLTDYQTLTIKYSDNINAVPAKVIFNFF